VQDVLIACVDGLSGFPAAINVVYPQTKLQLHIVQNSLKYVSRKERKPVAQDLKQFYQSASVHEGERALERFFERWGKKYPSIGKSWHRRWENIIIFDYPFDIRKAIYTTNTIESLNSVIRKATQKRQIFPHDNSAMKVVYLAITQALKK
jgi:transposase-like protein